MEDKTIVQYMNTETTLENIKKTLGNKTPQFIASVASLVNSNEALAKTDKKSVLSACLIAATLDLPINQNLGFAYIIPYKNKAQFQMGYKGFIQLAQRSGRFQTINVSDVRAGEIKGRNRLTGDIIFEWIEKDRDKLPLEGFVAYIKLTNGFEKSLYMTIKELEKHGLRYSQMAKRGYGLWRDDFEAMASKTVIKLLLSKYAPLTVEMQTAQLADQAVITDDGYKYVDNQPIDAKEVAQEKETERILKHIKESKTRLELEQCKLAITDKEVQKLYNTKLKTFK